MRTLLEPERQFIDELADIAAHIGVGFFRGDFDVRMKEDNTPVTDADVAIEAALSEAISARFPRDGFIGEEAGVSGTGARVWVVDPIDGTQNFVDHVPIWTTLITLTIEGQPELGLADAPMLGERYAAVRGEGATLNGSAIHVSGVRDMRSAFVLHSGIEEWLSGPYWPSFSRIAMDARRTRGISDSWGHLLVARGSADVMMEHEPCRQWDWAAPRLILEEAGGRMTTLAGEELYEGCNLLSTNAIMHEVLLAGLRPGPGPT